MNRRIFFIALAIVLPLALIVPLQLTRSRQPRVLKLAYRSFISVGQKDLTGLLWRANGLFVTRTSVPLQQKPLTVKNWNGQTVTVRATKADEASLDNNGQTAALLQRYSARLEHDLWDVEAAKSRGIIARLKGAQKQQHNAPNIDIWAISPDGKRVAWQAPAMRSVQIGDAKTARADANFKYDPSNYARTLAFAPDSRELAVLGNDIAWIIDAHTGKKRRQWNFNGNIHYTKAQWSPDGKYIVLWWGHPFQNAMGAGVNVPRSAVFLRVFDAQTGTLLQSWSQNKTLRQPEGITNVSFAPDGKHLAWGTFDGDAHLMNLSSGEIERHFPSPNAKNLSDAAHYVAFSLDGATLAVATQDKILLWRIG